MVRNISNMEDAKAILSTRISQNCIKDKLAWVHSKNGQYTVKTGYQKWHQTYVGNMGVQQSTGWSRLWRLEIPHKIKIFLWRLCRNNVPVRSVLRGKGVAVPIGCMMCVGDIEHLLHLFLDCEFAKECWHRMNLDFDNWAVENASEWLLHRLSRDTTDNLVKIAIVLWGIWFARNQKL